MDNEEKRIIREIKEEVSGLVNSDNVEDVWIITQKLESLISYSELKEKEGGLK